MLKQLVIAANQPDLREPCRCEVEAPCIRCAATLRLREAALAFQHRELDRVAEAMTIACDLADESTRKGGE